MDKKLRKYYIDELKQSDPYLADSFTELLLGEFLGQGSRRTVFSYALDEKLVVKVSKDSCIDNILEWELWNEIQHTEYSKWFAPCVQMSADGKVLFQRRTKNIKELPSELPQFMTDLKAENFGLIGKQIVAHDYAFGISQLMNMVDMKKMRKIKFKV